MGSRCFGGLCYKSNVHGGVVLPRTPGYLTVGAYVALDDPGYPLKSKIWQRTGLHEYGVGQVLAPKVKWKFYAGGDVRGSPVVADIDGDGLKEIIVVSPVTNTLHCLAGDGVEKWQLKWVNMPVRGTTVWDIDGDGKFEILQTVMGTSPPPTSGFFCINPDGSIRWSKAYPIGYGGSFQIVIDIDGDGEQEIIFGGSDGIIRCLSPSGVEKWVSEKIGGDIRGSAAADIDNDGKIETIWVTEKPGNIACLASDGTVKWNLLIGETSLVCGLSLADINGDGYKEVIAGEYYSGVLKAFRHDGTELWSIDLGYHIFALHTAIADIDGDGYKEILRGAGDGLYCLDHNGNVKWKFPTASTVDGSPSIGDIDNDGILEIIVGTIGGKVFCITPDGTEKWRYTTGGPIEWECISIDDVDADGMVELLVGSNDDYLYCFEEVPAHTVKVESSPFTGVPVTMDGNPIGVTPLSKLVEAKEHVFEAPTEVEV